MRIPIRLALAAMSLCTVWLLAADAAPATRPAQPLSDQIDKIVNQYLADAKVPASPQANDAEFLRRATLDLLGRIPTAERTIAFLQDSDPDKRRKLIDELLADSEYGEHFATVWFHQMVKRDSDNRLYISDNFQDWLAERFNKNVGWNKIASDILTAEGQRDKNPATVFWFAHIDAKREVEPNRATATAAKVFLGIRLECCECHNHPFASLKQTDFWGVAAFFDRVEVDAARKMQVKAGVEPAIHETVATGKGAKKKDEPKTPLGTIVIPDTKGKTMKAKYLLGAEAPLAGKTQARPTFAAWATAPNNPFFAKAMVNRVWAQLFGRGLVSPVDDMREGSKNSHPELLNALAREFASSGFDVKHLLRCICNSQAYQRSSTPLPGNKQDTELYSHALVRMMTADMLYDSLEVALSHAPADKGKGKGKAQRAGGGGRAQFRQFFHTEADDDASAVDEYAHGIPQVLRLMNSAQMNDNAAVIGKLLKAEGTPEKVVEALYLRILSRLPTAAERQRLTAYVKSEPDPARGYSDVMWVLLNSSEFMFNH